jgi:hypothetical protein
MSIREALIAVVALVMMAPPTIAANDNLVLECGAAKSTPPDNDSDPIYKSKIAVTDEVIYVVHYAASGETYIRNEQYRDQRFWAQEKTLNWSGVSIKRPDWTMVGTTRMDKGGQWVRVHREAICWRQATGDHRQRMPAAHPRIPLTEGVLGRTYQRCKAQSKFALRRLAHWPLDGVVLSVARPQS